MASFSSLFPSAIFGRQPLVILDGGMGTMLQAPPFKLASALDSALWSSELLRSEEGRAELMQLHELWVDSGAEVLGSCSYQSSLPLFLSSKDSYTPEDIQSALSTMLSALPIITSPAIASSSSSTFPSRQPPLAALSLGPFGAQLQPAQEYTGLYPPPFGLTSPSTRAYSDSAERAVPLPLDRVGKSSRLIGDSEDHLAAWHLLRLEHFAQSPAFEDMSLIAFETVPNLNETRAIRRAMKTFDRDRSGSGGEKPFYVSYVFPLNDDGQPRLPDQGTRRLSLDDQLDLLVEATFGESEAFATPSGIGINCTNPLHLETIVKSLAGGIERSQIDNPVWLVLYPDGGAVYDVKTRTWSNEEGMGDEIWASTVATAIVQSLETKRGNGRKTFDGILAGGCCKAGPGAIKELRRICKQKGWLDADT